MFGREIYTNFIKAVSSRYKLFLHVFVLMYLSIKLLSSLEFIKTHQNSLRSPNSFAIAYDLLALLYTGLTVLFF